MRNTAIFGLALSATCGAIRAVRPFPKVQGVYEKYLHFSRKKADYTVLFSGSSRIYRALIPEQFDASVAGATGQTVHSFNLGFDGMQPPESYFLLEKILALKPPNLRWVFVEGAPIQSVIFEGRPTRRMAYWHDARHTSMVFEAIAGESIPLAEKWTRWRGHGAHAFAEFTNGDLGAQWLRPRLGLEKPERKARWDPPKDWARRDGYAPLFEERLSGKSLTRYLSKVAERTPGPVRRVSGSWRRALDQLVAEIRAAGARPILLITPSVQGEENYTGYPEDVPLLRFQEPAEFPELFDPAHHFDQLHLNNSGARILTELVSARFIEMLKAGQ